MDIKWPTTLKYQSNIYYLTAKKIQQRIFQERHAILLPRIHKDFWFFPDYGVFKNHNIREKLNRVTFESGLYTDEIDNVLNDTKLLDFFENKYDLSLDEKHVHEAQRDIEHHIENFLKDSKEIARGVQLIKSLTIIPTKIGTSSSIMFLKKGNYYDLEIYYKDIYGASAIYQAICVLIVSFNLQVQEGNISAWHDRQVVTEFLWKGTPLSKYIKNIEHRSTLEYLAEDSGNIAQESAAYYAKLGYPLKNSFTSTPNGVNYGETPINTLSPSEKLVMDLLIRKTPEIASYDEIADALWKEEALEKFSLYAISKIIQKIRNKLSNVGIDKNTILAVKKKGYFLFP